MEPYSTFTSNPPYHKLLMTIIQTYSDFIQYLIDGLCIQEQFIQINPVSKLLKNEILPLFGIQIPDEKSSLSFFSSCSNFIESQFFGILPENIAIEILEIRSLFLILLNFDKYANFIKYPQILSKYPSLLNLLIYIREMLCEKTLSNSNSVDYRFLPFNQFQIPLKLALQSMETDEEFHQLLGLELNLLSQLDNSVLLMSSVPPKICIENPTVGIEFKNCIDSVKELFVQNHLIAEALMESFQEVDQLFHIFFNEFLEYSSNLFPIEHLVHIFLGLGYKFFLHQTEKESVQCNSIESLNQYYDKLKMKMILSNKSLKKDLNDRIHIEKQIYIQFGRKEIHDHETHLFNHLNIFQDIINVFENFKVLDRTIAQISKLQFLFSDQEAYNQSLSMYTNILSYNKQIDVLSDMIEDKYKMIDELNDEKEIVEQTTQKINQNIIDIDNIKQQVGECPICKFERKYVLTSCGHTFCDNCYQNFICLLHPDQRMCPFCQVPFSLKDILKIQWDTEII